MAGKKNRVNIRKRILLILCIVLSFTVIGNFIVSGEIFKKAQVTAFDREAFATARGLQTNVNSLIEKSYLPYTEIVNCQPLLDNFVNNSEDVLYTYTTDVNGNALYSSEKAVIDGISSERLAKAVSSGKETRIEVKKNETIYYILPLQEEEVIEDKKVVTQVGVLVVAYPRTCITEPLNRLYTYNAILAVFTFASSLWLIFLFLTKWITKPLQRLDEAIRNVSKKGLKKENSLEIKSNDEIGQIAGSFNDMLMQLDDTTVSKNYFDSILINMSEALFVLDANKNIEKVNDSAIRLLRCEREDILGRHAETLFAEGADRPFCDEGFTDMIDSEKLINCETEFVAKDGKIIDVSVNWSAIRDDFGYTSKYVCTARDITDVKKARSILMHQANYDELTGLSNRYNLEQSIEKILSDTSRKHVFIIIDLDKFKVVNDVSGHTAGDKLLQQIAYMLRQAAGDDNLVARLGGDEFAIIMYDTDIQKAKNTVEGLLRAVRNFSFTWDGKVFNVGMSVGAFEINRPGLDRLTIFNAADRACYIAKEKGGNRLHIYTEEDRCLDEKEEASLMPIITEAFENNRFYLVYQPIVSLEDKRKVHMYEALVRLKTKEGTVLEPGAFMSTAERYNKLLLLDQWVIHNFCENYHKNVEQLSGGSGIQFNINLTKASLNSEQFFDFVCQEFKAYNVPPSSVCFEVSESYVVSNFVDVTALIKKFRDLGCKFAIDNFGIGMSSFMYLRLLTVDAVKISGGLIRETEKSPIDMTVVKTIKEVAHLLNIKTVAGCVESEEILEKVKELGIDYAQGYEIMRPGKIEDVVKAISR